jgi:hypothetical protein
MQELRHGQLAVGQPGVPQTLRPSETCTAKKMDVPFMRSLTSLCHRCLLPMVPAVHHPFVMSCTIQLLLGSIRTQSSGTLCLVQVCSIAQYLS